MRISGFVVFVLVVAVGAFVYLGYSNPEIRFRTQVKVGVPVAAAFAGYTDEARLGSWVTNFVRIQQLRGEPNSVGSFSRLTLTEDGRDVIITREIVAFEENDRVAYDLEHSNMMTSVDVLFEPDASGTSIAALQTVRGKGLFWQALLRLRKGTMQEQQRTDMRRLKAMLESSAD